MSNNFSRKIEEYFHEITLNQATVNKTYVIVACNGQNDAAARLAEMGLVPQTAVTVLKTAPLGDPLEISVRGYSLCIRASEAEAFVVRPLAEQPNKKHV